MSRGSRRSGPRSAGSIAAIAEQLAVDARYAVYLKRQELDIAAFRKDEGIVIPDGFAFAALPGLSTELRQKLERHRPASLGQAARLDGMTPAALMLLLAHLKKGARRRAPEPKGEGRCRGISRAATVSGPQDFAEVFKVPRETIHRLTRYAELLTHGRARNNLVAPSTLPELWSPAFRRFGATLRLAPKARLWLDLGSGAGFPGLVIAILELGGRISACISSRATGRNARSSPRSRARPKAACGHSRDAH